MVFENSPSNHETRSIRCHAWIHTTFTPISPFTYSIGPSSIVWSELGLAPPFPPTRVLEVYRSRALKLVYEVALNTTFGVLSYLFTSPWMDEHKLNGCERSKYHGLPMVLCCAYLQEVVVENNPSDRETWPIPYHMGIHANFTPTLQLTHSSVAGSELGPAPPFPPTRVLEKCNSHGLSVSHVKLALGLPGPQARSRPLWASKQQVSYPFDLLAGHARSLFFFFPYGAKVARDM